MLVNLFPRHRWDSRQYTHLSRHQSYRRGGVGETPFPATRLADDSQARIATIQHQGLPNVEARRS